MQVKKIVLEISLKQLYILLLSFPSLKLLYQALRTFPKRDRYSLGQKIENIVLDVFELLFKVNMVDKPRKLELLENINAKLDLKKVLLRLAYDNKCLNNKSYISLESTLQELGKMAGGLYI